MGKRKGKIIITLTLLAQTFFGISYAQGLLGIGSIYDYIKQYPTDPKTILEIGGVRFTGDNSLQTTAGGGAGTFASQAEAEGGTETTKAMNSLRTYQAVTAYSFLKSNIDTSPVDGYPDKSNGLLGTTLTASNNVSWVMAADKGHQIQLSGAGTATVSKSGIVVDLMKGTQYIDLTPSGIVTATADGGLQKLAEGTITAGHMGARGVCKIYSLWSWVNDTSSKNPQIKFGDFLVYNGTTTSGSITFSDCRIVRNINSASVQRSSFGLTSSNSFTTTSSAIPTGTFNTANDTPIIISCNPGTNTVSLIHAFAEVTYIP